MHACEKVWTFDRDMQNDLQQLPDLSVGMSRAAPATSQMHGVPASSSATSSSLHTRRRGGSDAEPQWSSARQPMGSKVLLLLLLTLSRPSTLFS